MTRTYTSDYNYKTSTFEQDREAAKQVEDFINERGKKDKNESNSNENQLKEEEGSKNKEEEAAAKKLQGQYRSHVTTRTCKGMNLSSSNRWNDGLKAKTLSKANQDQASQTKNDSISRWKRTEFYVEQISKGPESNGDRAQELDEEEEMDQFARTESERQQIKEERNVSKSMESAYWLEMCDSEHRYGTNLKWYHKKWNEDDDSGLNFFEWLDHGPGKELDLEQCPRQRLENERITYLNAEQRRHFLVIPDPCGNGKLIWAESGKPVDTSKKFRYGGPDVGIVEMSEEEMKEKERKEKELEHEARDEGKEEADDLSDLEGDSSNSSSDEDPERDREGVKGYQDKGGTAGNGKGFSQIKARVHYYLSPRAVFDRLLRETINNNTWLFVSDLNHNLYVGLKSTGSFQHSSFLYGGRVLAAGLIKVDEGKLTSLSPLSGHYRAGTMHFKAFVRSLEEQKVDMSSVNISKSLMVIGGIEKYAAFSKKKKKLTEKLKSTLHLGTTKSQKKKLEDENDIKWIQREEKEKGHGDSNRPFDQEDEEEEEEDEDDDLNDPLPGDGKDLKSLPEKERIERGVALVQRAVARGIRLQQTTWGSLDGKKKKQG